MSRSTPAWKERFANRQAQIVLALFSVFIVLAGIGGVSRSSSTFAWIVLVFGMLSFARSLSSSDVVIDALEVRTRSIAWTHGYVFTDLREVEVAVGRTGMNGFGREYLVFHRSDGKDVAFKELNCRPAKDANPTVVRRAAACINDRISRV